MKFTKTSTATAWPAANARSRVLLHPELQEMDVPRFPAPPPASLLQMGPRSVSLDCNRNAANNSINNNNNHNNNNNNHNDNDNDDDYIGNNNYEPASLPYYRTYTELQQQHKEQQRGGGLHHQTKRRRPRSASWLVARKQSRRNRRPNHVQPLGPAIQPRILGAVACDYRLSTELKLTMANEPDKPCCADNDAATTTCTTITTSTNSTTTTTTTTITSSAAAPATATAIPAVGPDAVLQRIRETRSFEPRAKDDLQQQQQHHSRRRRRIDDADVICSAVVPPTVDKAEHREQQPTTPTITTSSTTSDRLSPVRPDERFRARAETMTLHHRSSWKSVAVQTSDAVLYRLRVFPTLKDIVDEETKPPDPGLFSRFCRLLRFLGRLALCQFGLAWLLTLWAILGAGAFYVTEGPRERQQVLELKDMQRDLAVSLATELRQLRAEDKEVQPLWSRKVQQYVARHEKLLLAAINTGYSEGGGKGQLWTFPGCALFSISVLTTLGFGAPVPRSSGGRSVAVVFAAIGIPAHFLLVLNLGLLCAVKLKRYGVLRRYPECRGLESIDSMPMPMWVKVVPFAALGVYYVIGIFCFGVARTQPLSDSLLFPLDFTVAGGLAKTAGYIRVCYALFLEGAVILTAFAVAVLKVSATQSLTNIGLRYGLLTPV